MAPRDPRNPAAAQRRAPPKPWQVPHASLRALLALRQTYPLEIGAIPDNKLDAAIDAWINLDPDAKEYLRDAMQMAQLQIADESRRILTRMESHLASIRTGSRLTVEALEALSEAPEAAEFGPIDAEFGDDGGDFVEGDDFPEGAYESDGFTPGGNPEDALSEGEVADAFAALDAAGTGVVTPKGAGGDEPTRKPRKAGGRRKAPPANGVAAAPMAEVFDADGNSVPTL
jgi:hypothetical protein